jgi:hypothetical protein
LLDLVVMVCESYTAAGWIDGYEYRVWDRANEPDAEPFAVAVLIVAQAAGGWPIGDSVTNTVRVAPWSEWLELVAERDRHGGVDPGPAPPR